MWSPPTWYTGAAGCMYRAGLEAILGLTRRDKELVIKPCIPRHWAFYEIAVNNKDCQYKIVVTNPQRRCSGISSAELDGIKVKHTDEEISVPIDRNPHVLKIVM
jgi:cyclic beta-1,2-glucan synthetase